MHNIFMDFPILVICMGFMKTIINIALNEGFNVVIKPHPSMNKKKTWAKIDRKYFTYIKKMEF